LSNPQRIRKQVYELTAEDLNTYSLWEFCLDEEGEEEQDECTVKPSEDHEVRGYEPGAYILACDVRYADGSAGVGYIYSGEPDDFGCTAPILILESGQVGFWLGSLRFLKDTASPVAAAMARLNKDAASVFPIQFQTRAPINGAPMELTVRGFMAKGADQKLTESGYVMVGG
jgi:hypothetical protein